MPNWEKHLPLSGSHEDQDASFSLSHRQATSKLESPVSSWFSIRLFTVLRLIVSLEISSTTSGAKLSKSWLTCLSRDTSRAAVRLSPLAHAARSYSGNLGWEIKDVTRCHKMSHDVTWCHIMPQHAAVFPGLQFLQVLLFDVCNNVTDVMSTDSKARDLHGCQPGSFCTCSSRYRTSKHIKTSQKTYQNISKLPNANIRSHQIPSDSMTKWHDSHRFTSIHIDSQDPAKTWLDQSKFPSGPSSASKKWDLEPTSTASHHRNWAPRQVDSCVLHPGASQKYAS